MLAGLLYLGSGCGLSILLVLRRLFAGEGRVDCVARRSGLGLACRRDPVRRHPWPRAADDRPCHQQRRGGIAAAQFRKRTYRGDRVVRVPREFRPAHRTGNGADRGGSRSALLGAGTGRGRARLAPVVAACAFWAIDNNLTRKVSASDAVVVAGLKGLDRRQRFAGVRAVAGAAVAAARHRGCRRGTRLCKLRGQPRAVRARAATAGRRAHRCVFRGRALLRRRARARRAAGSRDAAARRRGRADGDGRVPAPDRTSRPCARARTAGARAPAPARRAPPASATISHGTGPSRTRIPMCMTPWCTGTAFPGHPSPALSFAPPQRSPAGRRHADGKGGQHRRGDGTADEHLPALQPGVDRRRASAARPRAVPPRC